MPSRVWIVSGGTNSALIAPINHHPAIVQDRAHDDAAPGNRRDGWFSVAQ